MISRDATVLVKPILLMILLIATAGFYQSGQVDSFPIPASAPTSCLPEVDLFPVPVSDATSLFPSVDDSFLEVPFMEDFTFHFYGTEYSSIFLNTNGGFTFGSGNDDVDPAARDVGAPGVAVFWGDMNAAEADTLPDQMVYQQCSDRFVIRYTQFQDLGEATWNNTATVTLFSNGTVVVEYGDVLSEDILIGVFDGTHTDDQYLPVQAIYWNYQAVGTGIILFDAFDLGPSHNGEVSNQTITFSPFQPLSVYLPVVRR